MTDTPNLVDVRPQPGRRVRDTEGSLLPETHILRGVVRSAYWLRLERDRDVELTLHVPDEAAVPAAEAAPPAPTDLPPLPVLDGKKKG